MGIASSFTLLGNMLGPFSSGYIASYTSIEFIFILSGSLLVLTGIFVYFKTTSTPPRTAEEIIEDNLELKKIETLEKL